MEPARPSPKIRVLLVDDHRVVADALARLLAAEPDLEVVGTATSLEQLETEQRSDYDCILINYLLRDGSAAVATRIVKRRLPHARVVVLHRGTDAMAQSRAASAGADAFLDADSSSHELFSAVRGHGVAASSTAPRRYRRRRAAQSDPAHGIESLTSRERDVLRGLVLGRTTRQMCDEFGISSNTVRTHVQNIIAKLRVHSRLEAVALASREHLV